MKKPIITLTITAAVIALFASCSKSDSASTTVTPSYGSYTVRGITYTPFITADSPTTDFFARTGNLFAAAGYSADKKSFAEIVIYFTSTARPLGTYNIGGGMLMSSSQAFVLVSDSSAAGTSLYTSDSVTTSSLVITSTGSKLTASIPSIQVKGLFTPAGGTTHDDSTMISGSFTEK